MSSTPAQSEMNPLTYNVFTPTRRRLLLNVLSTEDNLVTVSDLTDEIIETESNHPELSPSNADDVCLSLRHRHLPLLEKAGLVNFYHDKNLVEPTDTLDSFTDQFAPMLTASPIATN